MKNFGSNKKLKISIEVYIKGNPCPTNKSCSPRSIGFPLHRENRENLFKKILPVGENIRNLNSLPKHHKMPQDCPILSWELNVFSVSFAYETASNYCNWHRGKNNIQAGEKKENTGNLNGDPGLIKPSFH